MARAARFAITALFAGALTLLPAAAANAEGESEANDNPTCGICWPGWH